MSWPKEAEGGLAARFGKSPAEGDRGWADRRSRQARREQTDRGDSPDRRHQNAAEGKGETFRRGDRSVDQMGRDGRAVARWSRVEVTGFTCTGGSCQDSLVVSTGPASR